MMPSALARRSRALARKSSNAENQHAQVRAKLVPYKASARLISSSNVLRDNSLRRRKRVLSGFPPASIVSHVKTLRQRLQKPEVACHTLPTPPASPGTVSVEMSVEIQTTPATPVASSPSPLLNTVKLPRTLRRPASNPISRRAMEGVDPELSEIPMGYVRQATEYLAPEMLKVLTGVKVPPFTIPAGYGLPKELAIIVNDLSADMPTHILAVQQARPASQAQGPASRTKVEIYPVHDIVVATQCTRLSLPPTPQPRAPAPTVPGSTLTLPVVPIALPHAESYPILQNYLYDKSPEHLFAALLPRAPPREALGAAQTHSVLAFAALLADTFTPQVILRHAMRTHGLYANMCTLGVEDDRLWYLVRVAYEILQVAAAVSAQNLRAHTSA